MKISLPHQILLIFVLWLNNPVNNVSSHIETSLHYLGIIGSKVSCPKTSNIGVSRVDFKKMFQSSKVQDDKSVQHEQ